MKYIFPLLLSTYLFACNTKTQTVNGASKVHDTPSKDQSSAKPVIEKIEKTDEEWKAQLSEFEYYVIRDKGTERAHTGDLLNIKKEGTYTCKACDLPLFDSDTKFKSGTGWPSYYEPIDENNIIEETDYKIGYPRTEVMCARCEGHLGHVFDDGPNPTGLRYCINSVSLKFVATKKQE